MHLLGLALVFVPLWIYVAAILWATIRFSRRPTPAAAARRGITVLKPLHGAEPGLADNLRSFVDQDYAPSQVVFGVRNLADAALPIARQVIAERPQSDLTLVVDGRATGSNLKIANLENMLPAARHDLIVLADADMRAEPNYLAAVAAPLHDPAVGLVTCPYKGVSNGGLWSQLGAMHINYAFLPAAILGAAMNWGGGCFGATIAMRRDVFDRIGGFARVRNELADDHRLGAAVRELGLKAELSRYIVENRVSEASFASLWLHEVRWARTSRLMAPGGFAGSVVTHTMMVSLLAVLVSEFSTAACLMLLGSCLLRWGSAAAVAVFLGLPQPRPWLLPLRDGLSFAVFIASFCGRNVLWRDQVFRVEPGGRMTAAEGDKPV